MQATYDPDKRKLLSALCHGLNFLGLSMVTIGVPIAVLLVSDDPVVKENAKESINFHLNLWVVGGVIAFLYFILIGWLLSPILIPIGLLYNLIFPGWAVFKCLTNPEVAHRYPFIFRLPL